MGLQCQERHRPKLVQGYRAEALQRLSASVQGTRLSVGW